MLSKDLSSLAITSFELQDVTSIIQINIRKNLYIKLRHSVSHSANKLK